ncbi:MAG: ArsC/Spx/MgsR family protein [Rhodospirillales bacterium]|nr:ArsC/Spx/MgsR family protein [Rhodospirillales bacterium]
MERRSGGNGHFPLGLFGWRGTTWRGLTDEEHADFNEEKACRLMAKYPALVKRPVFELDGGGGVGFKEEQKTKILNSG